MSIALIALQIVVGLVGLSFLVFIHELGHFLIAKKAGVKVYDFAIGFGPKLFKRTYGETTYSFSLIPLGGYVRMAGEEDDEDGEDETVEKDRLYSSKPLLTRAAILLGGPLVNIVFAFLVFWAVILMGTNELIRTEPMVLKSVDKGLQMERAGVRAGDTILGWNGQKADTNHHWDTFYMLVMTSVGKPISIEVGSPSGRKTLTMTPTEHPTQGTGVLGFSNEQRYKKMDQSFFASGMSAAAVGWQVFCLPFETLPKLFTGELGLKAMSGPVGMVQATGSAWTEGLIQGIFLLGIISMSLGAMNLLPLVITDGGQLMFLFLEAIRGKPLSNKVMMVIQYTMMAFLLSLAVYATVWDIIRF